MEIVHAGAYFDFDMTIQWNSNQRKLMALLLPPFLAWRWIDAYQPLELKPPLVNNLKEIIYDVDVIIDQCKLEE